MTSYLGERKIASLKSISLDIDELSFKIQEGELEEMQIQYLKQSFEIQKIILKYRREIQLNDQVDSEWVKPRLEIVYSNTSFEGRNKALLNMNAFVSGSGKNWKAVGKYSSYQIINNLHDNPSKQ